VSVSPFTVESLMKLSPYPVPPVLFVAVNVPLPTMKYRFVPLSTARPLPPIQMPPSPAFSPFCATVLLGVVLNTQFAGCTSVAALNPMTQP
jgi:hypothetical protein